MAKKVEPQEEIETPEPNTDENTVEDAVEQWKETALRAQAELINFRNRTQREREQLWSEIRADTAAQFLPVLDNLGRAMDAPCSDEAYKQGVAMTLRQFSEVFQKLGITEIEAEGKTFDPQWMEAVLHEEDESLGENTVAEVFQKGYRMGDRALRHAVVKVVN